MSTAKEQEQLVQSVIETLQKLQKSNCFDCGSTLCSHEGLFCIVTGYKKDPRCLSCLSKEMDNPQENLREQLYQHIQRRFCWEKGWEWSNEQEHFPQNQKPSCIWKS